MKEISDIFNQLNLVSTKSNDNIIVTDTYQMLSNAFIKWSENVVNTAANMDFEIREFFSYLRFEYSNLRDLLDKTENAKLIFHKNEKWLTQRKDYLFNLQNLAKWEMNHEETKSYQKEKLLKDKPLAYSIMCYTETKNVVNLKQYYAFYATALFEEYDRLRTQNGDKFKKTDANFC